jgi:hypothetical protein
VLASQGCQSSVLLSPFAFITSRTAVVEVFALLGCYAE